VLTGAIFSLSVTPIWFHVADSLSGNHHGYRIVVGNQVLRSGVRIYRAHRGAFRGLAMACQILVSLWDMWIAPLTASARAKPQEIRSQRSRRMSRSPVAFRTAVASIQCTSGSKLLCAGGVVRCVMMSLRNLPVTLRVLFSSFLIVIGIG